MLQTSNAITRRWRGASSPMCATVCCWQSDPRSQALVHSEALERIVRLAVHRTAVLSCWSWPG
jgi:hypothetical protein